MGSINLLPPLGEGSSLGICSTTAKVHGNQQRAEELIQEYKGIPSWENGDSTGRRWEETGQSTNTTVFSACSVLSTALDPVEKVYDGTHG